MTLDSTPNSPSDVEKLMPELALHLYEGQGEIGTNDFTYKAPSPDEGQNRWEVFYDNGTVQGLLPDCLQKLRNEGFDPSTKFENGVILIQY